MQELCKSFLCNLKKPFLVFFLILFLSGSLVLAGSDEIFVTGILRNGTNNSLIEDTLDIFINITNTSDGALVYSQTQSNIFIDDGVYHVTFTSVTDPRWFLYPVNFTLKIGDVPFTSKEVVPVPISHACFVANDSDYLDGIVASSYYETSDGELVDWDKTQNYTGSNDFQGCASSLIVNGRWQNGTFNCTTDQTAAGGTSNPPFTDVDNVYIYNNSGTISFNESRFNVTIDNNSIIRSQNTSWINETVNGSYVPYDGAFKNIDLGANNFTIDTNTLFVDINNNRVLVGQTAGYDPRKGFSVSGDFDVNYTATKNDDHAVEIDVDAAGFGDVKGVDIVYTTGAISTGEDEGIILINIDESLATGGDVVGVEIIATEGSATIYGLEAGVLVNPVIQLSGTFGDMDSANNSGVDNLSNFISSADNHPIFVNDNDYVTIGDANKFEEIEFLLNTTASGAGIKPTFEYSTGVDTWGTFSPIDGTNGMRNTGIIVWLDEDIPTWATGAGTEFLIRINRTANSLVTVPIESKVQISAVTLYRWTKDGDLVINEVNASKLRSDNWTNVTITDSQISDLPTCGAGEFTTSDGTDFTCDTPSGGGGAGDKWVDDGGVISPNASFASIVNASTFRANGGTNISKTDINVTNVFASFYSFLGTDLTLWIMGRFVNTSWTNVTYDAELDNGSIVRSQNASWILTNVGNWSNDYLDYINDTRLDNNTIVRDHNTSWLVRNVGDWSNDYTDYINDTRLDNDTIVRSGNTSWITSNVGNWLNDYTDYINDTRLDNDTIVRSSNTSWITSNQQVWNASDAYFSLMNVTTNLTIANSSSGFSGIWYNGSGICISSC